MMQFMHAKIGNVKGQVFYKLMGSGKDGFNPLPDWNVYGLLQVWENEEAANDFLANAKAIQRFRTHTVEMWTVYMKNITAKGAWSKQNPFTKHAELDDNNPLIAVITRATIKTSKLRTFWKYVPKSQVYLKDNPKLLFTKGIGEVPFTQMATFSIWLNADALKTFAYKHQAHKDAVIKTRELQWYKEELFSRFQPYKSVGTWEGKNILKQLPG